MAAICTKLAGMPEVWSAQPTQESWKVCLGSLEFTSWMMYDYWFSNWLRIVEIETLVNCGTVALPSRSAYQNLDLACYLKGPALLEKGLMQPFYRSQSTWTLVYPVHTTGGLLPSLSAHSRQKKNPRSVHDVVHMRCSSSCVWRDWSWWETVVCWSSFTFFLQVHTVRRGYGQGSSHAETTSGFVLDLFLIRM